MRKILLAGGGFLCFALGAVGLFVPVWPTTPFVLLSVGCFSGMPTIRAKILHIGFIREHYENYQTRKGLRRRTLLASLGFLWGMLLVSMLIIRNLPICCLLIFIGLAVTVHLLCMSRDRRKPQEDESE